MGVDNLFFYLCLLLLFEGKGMLSLLGFERL